jgi:hypothetical protein
LQADKVDVTNINVKSLTDLGHKILTAGSCVSLCR